MGLTAQGVAEGMQQDAAGTIQTVLNSIERIPKAEQAATLKVLFGQWAGPDAAKLLTNRDTFAQALADMQNPEKYTGSMAREFIIKADTPEAVNTMLGSSISAIKGEIGENFLPKRYAPNPADFPVPWVHVCGRGAKSGRGDADGSALHPKRA